MPQKCKTQAATLTFFGVLSLPLQCRCSVCEVYANTVLPNRALRMQAHCHHQNEETPRANASHPPPSGSTGVDQADHVEPGGPG